MEKLTQCDKVLLNFKFEGKKTQLIYNLVGMDMNDKFYYIIQKSPSGRVVVLFKGGFAGDNFLTIQISEKFKTLENRIIKKIKEIK